MTDEGPEQCEVINGVDLEKVLATVEAIKDSPEIARFQFRAQNTWIDGGHNRTVVKNFYGALQEHQRERPFELEADEPPVLLGGDKGPNPVEYLLASLSGYLTSSLIYHAAMKGIRIKGLQSRLEGDLDLRGFLGLSADANVGYENIRVYFKIDADVPERQKQELIQVAQRHSPVFNMLASSTPVFVSLEE